MANIRIKSRLERIQKDINEVAKHIQMYHGVPEKEFYDVDNMGADIATTAAQICAMARDEAAKRGKGQSAPAGNLVKNIRRALGFSNP